MEQKCAVICQIGRRVDWIIEHRSHRQPTSKKRRVPNLLAMERQQDHLAIGVGYSERLHTARIDKGARCHAARFRDHGLCA